MPVATTSGSEVERFDLKTAPPDGFVEIRRMTYGEYLRRRQMGSNMKLSSGGKQQGFEGTMQLVNQQVTEYEFAMCVMDHNLTDANDTKLDFKKPATLQYLDPRIGEEISTYIDKVNAFDAEGEEDLGNSHGESDSPS